MKEVNLSGNFEMCQAEFHERAKAQSGSTWRFSFWDCHTIAHRCQGTMLKMSDHDNHLRVVQALDRIVANRGGS
jgi:hypothetical protein